MWILHADADSFFAAVAQRDDPSLRGRPVVVGGGVCTAASAEAKRCGVRSGMREREWRARCPDAVVVSVPWGSVRAASADLMACFEATGAVVEAGGLEEAFLDVRGVGAAPEVAARLRRSAWEEVGLPVSVGVARTKVLAKLASRAAKPDGLRIVPPAQERAFLHLLPVEEVWGVGPRTAARLHGAGLRTVGEVAHVGAPELAQLLGRAAGRYVHAVAQGHDLGPVQPRQGRRSFGAQRAIGHGHTADELQATLAQVAERVASRMERAGRGGRTVSLRLRLGRDGTLVRSSTLGQATADPALLLTAARALLDEALHTVAAGRVTLVGLGVTGLAGAGSAGQLTLDLG